MFVLFIYVMYYKYLYMIQPMSCPSYEKMKQCKIHFMLLSYTAQSQPTGCCVFFSLIFKAQNSFCYLFLDFVYPYYTLQTVCRSYFSWAHFLLFIEAIKGQVHKSNKCHPNPHGLPQGKVPAWC